MIWLSRRVRWIRNDFGTDFWRAIFFALGEYSRPWRGRQAGEGDGSGCRYKK
jgi:hypothetical protein